MKRKLFIEREIIMLFKNNSKKYLGLLNKSGIFDNSVSEAFPQTQVYEVVKKHLKEKNDKHKKVLIYGFDGARADAMFYLIPSSDQGITGHNLKSPYSAVTRLKESGGLFLSYAGGDKSKPETIQETSTAQGWSAILTGKWGNENGVQKHVTKKNSAPTILMECAENGMSALFASIWEDHFTITYKDEIKTAKSKKLPLEFRQVGDEAELQSAVLSAVGSGTDIIFAINEFPDYNGHSHGFGPDNYRYVTGITNADRYAFELIEHIESRPEFENEDWLYLITSDHGGHNRGHGTQLETDRMTFIALNKPLLK